MALPVLNEYPKYTLELPSTKQKITYRPYIVKEQRQMLLALESNDPALILQSITDTIQSCVVDGIDDIDTLATFDVEYIFTKIRSKSVGEKAEVNIKCQQCGESTPVSIQLDQITMADVPKPPTIKLNDQWSLRMKYPQYKYMVHNEKIVQATSYTQALFELIVGCLDKLLGEEEAISFADESREDVEAFLDRLTDAQFSEISKFVNNLPKMTHDVEFDCASCQHHNKMTLRGINDFF